MKKQDIPITPAIRMLRDGGIPFTPHGYPFAEQDVAAHAAHALGVPEHEVVKTLVMEYDSGSGRKLPILVLMHADREVSTRQLARVLGVKSVAPASRADVQKYSGYVPGGVSPFGTRSSMPVYAEATVFTLPRLFINGGKRGFMVEMCPADLRKLIPVTDVNIAV